MFRFRWMRRFIRRRMKPIPPDTALNAKQKISILYMFLAWNAFGMVIYLSVTGRKDWPSYYGLKSEEEATKVPAVYFAELLGIKRADIVSYKRLTKIKEFEYRAPEESDS